jgi:hypothetical protein
MALLLFIFHFDRNYSLLTRGKQERFFPINGNNINKYQRNMTLFFPLIGAILHAGKAAMVGLGRDEVGG